MPSELEQRLRRTLGGDATQTPEAAARRRAHRQAEEGALLAALQARGKPPAPRRRLRLPRLALVGALGVGAAVGACALPAEYPVSLGYGLEIELDAEGEVPVDPEAIAMFVRHRPGIERVEVHMGHRVQEHAGPDGEPVVAEQRRLQVFAFGGGLDTDALTEALVEQFPALVDAEIHDVPLSGTVHGTLGGKLSHRFLDLVIDRHGVEEAERQILEELIASGVAPDHAAVDVSEVRDAEGNRHIRVWVQAEGDEATLP